MISPLNSSSSCESSSLEISITESSIQIKFMEFEFEIGNFNANSRKRFRLHLWELLLLKACCGYLFEVYTVLRELSLKQGNLACIQHLLSAFRGCCILLCCLCYASWFPCCCYLPELCVVDCFVCLLCRILS